MRGFYKTTILVASLIESVARFSLLRIRVRLQYHREPTSFERARWLHGCCYRILRRIKIRLITNGELPKSGLVVSNHLSHLDILLYGALGPIIFVAKDEVRRWPLLGTLATCGGTVFVDRESPAQAVSSAHQIENYLRSGITVLLFPEGTSSDGATVLPFRSPLFEPAIRARAAVTASAIRYSADDAEESTLSYWGDKVFFSHLYTTLGWKNLLGSIRFSERQSFSDRKEAARSTHAAVSRLRQASPTHAPESRVEGFVVLSVP